MLATNVEYWKEIRTIRAIFSKISLKYDGRLTTEVLRTSMYEMMYLMSSKRLTTDCLDSPNKIIVTPTHLLTSQSSQSSSSPGSFDGQKVYGRDMYQKTQQLAEEFWRHWQDYLVTIKTRQKWTAAQKTPRWCSKYIQIISTIKPF